MKPVSRRVQLFVLVSVVLAPLQIAIARGNSAKLADSVDLPSNFDIDFQLASKQRTQIQATAKAVPDDVAGRVGAEVFRNLVDTQMITSFGLPYKWTFSLYDSPAVNAGSLPDGEVEADTGLSRLIGTNRGLWAAALSHEVAHVARRHGVRKYLYHQYIEEQIRYWQLRSYYGDKNAGWAVLALRIAGGIAEKKLSRDMEHDADAQGMLLMARAGYHPDYVFAMHHLLRINSGEQSKFGAFFSDHPRWETRDQRSERAYSDALAEYNRLWSNPAASPGGTPPAVAFVTDVRGTENKSMGSGDVVLALTCRNATGPINVVVHVTKDNGRTSPQTLTQYTDPSGNVAISAPVVCSDADSAKPAIVHIPTALVSDSDRKLRAQVELLDVNSKLLERSRKFDVHFPKRDKKHTATLANVIVEPAPVAFAAPMPAVEAQSQPSTPPSTQIATEPAAQKPSTTALAAAPTPASTVPVESDTPQAQVGAASVTSEPDGADIFVDSHGVGLTPMLIQLTPGEHSIQIVKEGYTDWAARIVVKAGSITNVSATLNK